MSLLTDALLITVFIVKAVISQRPNVIMIVVDDLRPALGCYGDKNAFTPNIDKLARDSILFKNAFVQQAICAPSRNSFLTSRRPDTLHLYDFYSYWRSFAGNFTTLPQYFKENGYYTVSIGKIFHPGASSNYSDDQPYSWSETPFHPPTEIYKNARVCPDKRSLFTLYKNLICPVLPELQPGKTLPDIESTNAAKSFLHSTKESGKPFFLALGYHKPHIPLKYPVKYRDYHPLENVSIPGWRYRSPFQPLVSWNPWTDVRAREDIRGLGVPFPLGQLPDEVVKLITQSYYSAVTYIDDLIGEVISELKSTNNYENTVIALFGDHGWSLGEHGEWSKFSNFEIAVRVPFILKVPKLTTNSLDDTSQRTKYKECKELVEMVDLFPTLVELAGLQNLQQCPDDSRNITLCTEGISAVPVMENVNFGMKNTKKPFKHWKTGVFSQYPRPGVYPTEHPNSDKPKLEQIKVMGYSLRTHSYRYTEWVKFSNLTPNWDALSAVELYDHSIDPNETINLSSQSPLKEMMENLSKELRLGWKKSLPQFL